MTRFAPRLMVLLLCGTALAACSTMPDIAQMTGGKTAAEAEKAQITEAGKNPNDLSSSVRQAQLLRLAGQYDAAVKILSQLMLVASDDPRVVGEYGKTLTEQGRASEAVQFLSRATELQPNDWTLYSAMGVADDQLGDQTAARAAYEHALILKPSEPSVLSNYALSRMLANDPDAARALIARAQNAGGNSDPKIARDIALVNQLAPAPDAPAAAVASAPSKPVAVATSRPLPLPYSQQPIVIPAPPPANIVPTAAPRPLMPQQQPQQQSVASIPRQAPLYAPYNPVVMQAVPFDPLAGPVQAPIFLKKPHSLAAASHAPVATVAAKPVKADKTADAKADAKPAAKPAPGAKPDAKAPVKTASKNAVPALRMAADKF